MCICVFVFVIILEDSSTPTGNWMPTIHIEVRDNSAMELEKYGDSEFQGG